MNGDYFKELRISTKTKLHGNTFLHILAHCIDFTNEQNEVLSSFTLQKWVGVKCWIKLLNLT